MNQNRNTFVCRTTATAPLKGRREHREKLYGAEFSEGYFAINASPFQPVKHTGNNGEFMVKFAKHVEGFERLYTMHLLHMRLELQDRFFEPLDDGRKAQLRGVLDNTKRYSDPNRLLDLLQIAPWTLKCGLKEYFSFDFHDAEFKARELAWALDFDGRHTIPEERAEVLREAPETLRRLAEIYDTAEIYLCDCGVESAANYLDVVEKLKIPLHELANDLELKLIARGWRDANESLGKPAMARYY